MVRVAGQVHRAAAVARGIADKNVDICLLQECEDLATQDFLVESLRDSGYSTFVRDLGAHDPVRNVSGLFIASKVPLEGVRWLPFIDKTGLGKWSNQGALAVDIRLGDRSVRLINAHLNYGGEEAQEVRNRQFAQIQAMMHEGAVLFADLNFDTSRHPLEGGYINALEGRVTCSDEPKHALRGKPYEGCDGCEEKIDGIVYGPQARVRVTVEELGPLKAGEKALSDHFASVATVAAQ
jgi:endonuclease/exonuclease/phosphatase family metal-dependent hydrolase